MRINDIDYISLTDLARYKNPTNPGDVIIKWMSNKSSFTMSPSRWINKTNAIVFVSKRGKYDGGTFDHLDIALEFASWIDNVASFKDLGKKLFAINLMEEKIILDDILNKLFQ